MSEQKSFNDQADQPALTDTLTDCATPWHQAPSPGHATEALQRRCHALRARAARTTAARRSLYGIGLGVVSVLVLLLAFQWVVRQSVQQGETRRLAFAQQTAFWSDCNRLHGRTVRDHCVEQGRTIEAGAATRQQPAAVSSVWQVSHPVSMSLRAHAGG